MNIPPNETPERIYHWQNSQLSIARHYGGCKFNGADYVVAFNEKDAPLVRVDVLKRECKAKKAKGMKDCPVYAQREAGES